MIIETEREMGRQILRLTAAAGKSDFREEMLLHNEIEGILRPEVRTINESRVYEYGLEGLISLEGKCSRGLSAEDLRTLLGGIERVVSKAKEYLLRESDFVVGVETVFFDGKEGGLQLVCYPGYGKDLRSQIAELAESCLDSVNYSDDEAVLLAYGFYMQSKEESLTLADLTKLSERTREKEAEVTREERVGKDIIIPATGEEHFTEKRDAERKKNLSQRRLMPMSRDTQDLSLSHKSGRMTGEVKRKVILIVTACSVVGIALLKSGLFTNEATGKVYAFAFPVTIVGFACLAAVLIKHVLSDVQEEVQLSEEDVQEDETVFLLGDISEDMVSIVSDTFPTLEITSFPYIIGKSRSECDFYVDGKGISRKHFRIDRRDEKVTVTDMGSTNGTFVNSRKLTPNCPCTIKEGDEIQFGRVTCYVNHL